MTTPEEVRALLLEVCDHHWKEVLKKDYGTQRPDPGKLIREGIRKARGVIELTPVGAGVREYLVAVAGGLEALKERCRRDPISDDGWNDEDGYILGGISTIQRAIEERRRR